jgi:small-conductance mechanosensitive channel
MNLLSAVDFFDRWVGLLGRVLTHLFGTQINAALWGPVTGADLCAAAIPIVLALLLNVAVTLIFRHQMGKAPGTRHWRIHFFGGLGGPVYLFIWLAAIYLSVAPLLLKFWSGDVLQDLERVLKEVFIVAGLAALLWLCLRLTRAAEKQLDLWTEKIPGRAAKFLVPLLGRSLRGILPALIVIFAWTLLGLAQKFGMAYDRFSSMVIILVIAWILAQAVDIGVKALLAQYDVTVADNLRARKVHTQARLLARTIHVAIAICTLAFILMLFQEVRHVGASMLASAGIVGIVAGLAAQKTLGNLIAGFQIALAQPMRLDDVVIVDNQWGCIEEITLTYVVVHVWNDIRLVVPFSYFIEKSFQNWTRSSSRLLEQVTVWMDYSLPLDRAREALKEIIETNELWDKRFWNLQVVAASDKAMQLRVLATAADASIGWNLTCDIREKFILFVQKNYPQCLPRYRADVENRAPSVPSPSGSKLT